MCCFVKAHCRHCDGVLGQVAFRITYMVFKSLHRDSDNLFFTKNKQLIYFGKRQNANRRAVGGDVSRLAPNRFLDDLAFSSVKGRVLDENNQSVLKFITKHQCSMNFESL